MSDPGDLPDSRLGPARSPARARGGSLLGPLVRGPMRLPRPLRKVIFIGPAAITGSWVARRRSQGLLAGIAVASRAVAGPRESAEALLLALATTDAEEATHRTAARNSRWILAFGHAARLDEALGRIAEASPDDEAPELEAARAARALREGAYRRASEHARRAVDGGLADAGRLRRQAEGTLAALTPGWIPSLGIPAVSHGSSSDAIPGRVLHLVSSSLPFTHAGYNIRTAAVVASQRSAGLDPHVAVRTGYRTAVAHGGTAYRLVHGIPTTWLGPLAKEVASRPDAMQTASARLALDVARTMHPAVVQATSDYRQAQIALALREALGVPAVYEVRGFWEDSWASAFPGGEAEALETDLYRLTREVETAAMAAADAVVTLSELMRAEIIARGVAPAHVVVVPNAVEAERFEPQPRDDALGARLGIEHGDPVIGYISSLNAYEGIGYLLEAAAVLRTRVPRLRVLLVGDGPDAGAIRQRAQRLRLDDGTLVMVGRVPHAEISGYYSLIDVFVVPRTNHRVSRLVTPLKPYEAMALGKAVVVSDVPALREIVKPGETGYAFRAEDGGDLAEVLGQLLDDPGLRQRIGEQARAWVLAERTWSANGRRYRDLYERLGATPG